MGLIKRLASGGKAKKPKSVDLGSSHPLGDTSINHSRWVRSRLCKEHCPDTAKVLKPFGNYFWTLFSFTGFVQGFADFCQDFISPRKSLSKQLCVILYEVLNNLFSLKKIF
ncbi:hypothetical protein DPMN_060576 [Dreissena polymorpha]|uniref:Uncharacterized protein n=1 Tax=Dreissena polymorpha TaxID=45954 RepID=A0A9D4C658_DREPO|nr:hypothetical protein DPMN_060576 [Dreissena polymorpha]